MKHQLKEQGQLTTLETLCPTFRARVWVLYNAKDARDGAYGLLSLSRRLECLNHLQISLKIKAALHSPQLF